MINKYTDRIKKYPSLVLRKKCEPVQEMTAYEEKLFEDMLYIMRLSNGIGLAAPQIGISKRLVAADIGQGAIKLANPEVVKRNGKEKMIERCLSIPGAEVEVERASGVTVTGLNEKGEFIELAASGLLARVLQHEIDHLKGRLIIDYWNFWKRTKFKMGYFWAGKSKYNVPDKTL